MPRGQVGEVVASELTSHHTVNWEEGVCRGSLLGSSALAVSTSRTRTGRAAPALAGRIPPGRRRASGSQSLQPDEVNPSSSASEESQLAALIPFTSLFAVHLARSWEKREAGAGKSGEGSKTNSSENERKPSVRIQAKNRS